MIYYEDNMAHKTQQEWCKKLSEKFPQYFNNVKVLDIGALDINGNNRGLFTDSDYTGLDIVEGKNVDVVSVGHEYNAPMGSFDVILSTNALEHDIHYPKTLNHMVHLLRSGGFMFFTVPYKIRVHGTRKHNPKDSPTSQQGGEWADYFKILTPQDIRDVLDLDGLFSKYELTHYEIDMVFWGIKK